MSPETQLAVRPPFAPGKGFLYPVHDHRVVVQSIGVVHYGYNKREAHRAFLRWRKYSQADVGRASGKKVTHFTDKEITNEYMVSKRGD